MLIKLYNYTIVILRRKKLIWQVVLLSALLLYFSGRQAEKDSLEKFYIETKKQDSLEVYFDHLFDYIDANPSILIGGDDSLVQTVWRIPNSADEKLSYYHLLTNIAYHLLRYRQIPASIKWYEKAYRFYEENKKDSALANEMYFEEYVCKPLGNNYTRMGDFSKALFVQQLAIQSAQQKKLPGILPGLYGNLATTYFHAQQYDSVQTYIDAGLQVTPSNHPQIVNLYNLKAEAFLETGQKDSAVFWNDKAMRLSGNFLNVNKDAVVITYLDKARILNQSANHSEAIKYLHKARAFVPDENVAEKVELAIETGNAYLLANKTDSSILWHNIALSFFNLNSDGLYPDFKVTTALFGIATALMYHQQDSAAACFEKAVLNDYYTQQLLPTSINSRTTTYAYSKYSEVAIALHHQLYDQTKNKEYLIKAMWLAELSKGRQLLSEQQRSREWLTDSTLIRNKALSDELKSLYLNLAETNDESFKAKINNRIRELEYHLSEGSYDRLLQAPHYIGFKKWIETRDARTTLLSYYFGETYLFAVKLQKDGYAHFLDTAVKERKQHLKKFVQHYFYEGPDAFNNDPVSYYQQSNELLQQWNPWFETNGTNILVSADGPLHTLPLESLCTSASQPVYFGETNAVTYSFSFLQNLQQHVKHQKPLLSIFTFGKPYLGFVALPESESEKKFLAKKFTTESFNAASTNISEFINVLQSGNLIHFASHAVAGDSSQQNFLVLKNKLYLGQLQYITTNCPLMVLAACETGTGTLKQGEGMESLGRAFLCKGVGGVISTRWPVDDNATSAIIKLFYTHLKKVGNPARALQLARREYIASNSVAAAKNPWLWAAFTYQGNGESIEIASNPKPWMLLSIVICAALMLLFWMRFKRKK